MATEMDLELLTIAETAELLKVSIVTIHRWLKQGRLPAYRLGPRRIRIRRKDLDELLTPLSKKETSEIGQTIPIETRTLFRRLTEDEVRQRLEAIREAQDFREEVAARRGGKPFAPSWPLIRKAREERSKRL